MLTVKILGPGCANCKRLEQIVRKVVSDLSLDAQVVKVSDYGSIMTYDLLSTPGLVINEKVVSAGRVPSPGEVTTWLANVLEG